MRAGTDADGVAEETGFPPWLKPRCNQVVKGTASATDVAAIQVRMRRALAWAVPGDNLPPEKALLLLQLALTKTSDPHEIKRYFDQY